MRTCGDKTCNFLKNIFRFRELIDRIVILTILCALPSISHAEIIQAVPVGITCILAGTGTGTCDIVFPENTVNGCPSTSRVSFDPRNGVLGKEAYAMVIIAASAQKTFGSGCCLVMVSERPRSTPLLC